MSCGRILLVLRIKWNLFYQQVKFWLFRNKSEYFYCSGCCIGCKYFFHCYEEFMDIQEHPDYYANGEGYYQQK